jgi:WD40 repeat protein
MAPEQIRLQAVDHRADIFAFGCVLYEMLSGRRAFHGETPADTMSAILTKDPEPLSGAIERLPAALDQIVRRCLEKRPEDRFGSARDAGFALQAVVDSVPREIVRRPEEIRPYPGLAAFTEADAERFYGRDEETAALWRTIPERGLLALIGPSGAGKTSFLRAGLVPHAPPGWRCVVATPGRSPFAALARAFVPEFAGDLDATGRLFLLHEPEVAVEVLGHWKSRCDHGLVVIDQFEELFTLNGEDVQARFADLLGTIAAVEGIHVLLSMRDDFFFQCSGHEALASVFSAVTPLRPLGRDGLTDALVMPAKRFGFVFEDEALVGEMIGAVAAERGALPLLAFSVARLWEERDRERKLLTRQACERLGGVGGALAQHAEATLERIGGERQPIVRELFRNLVTAQQTRCLIDVEELLSVFPSQQRADARQVLERLVEARLLTGFEEEGTDGRHRQRVEVVHESLLTAWPRLVRWQAQDAEGALLRDQLRRAAHLWEEKGRPADLLWTGSTVTEYALWRERYPGGLSDLEESFGRAMTDLAGRRRQRRRAAVAIILTAVTLGAISLGAMWRRSAQETRRAEAAQLVALGRTRLADHPNAALAYAIASLEWADNEAARRFAVETLWQGPTARFFQDPVYPTAMAWSPDGRWLALGPKGIAVLERDTNLRLALAASENEYLGQFSNDGRRLATLNRQVTPPVLRVWSLPEGRLETSRALPAALTTWRFIGDSVLVFTRDGAGTAADAPRLVRRLAIDEAVERVLGRWEPHGLTAFDVDPTGTWLYSLQGGRLVQQRLDDLGSPGRVLGEHAGEAFIEVRPWRDRVVTSDAGGTVRIWNVASGGLERMLRSPGDARTAGLDPAGRYLAAGPSRDSRPLVLFDLAAPASAEATSLRGREYGWLNRLQFSPDGAWLASVNSGNAAIWNLRGPRAIVLGRHEPPFLGVVFTPNGELLSTSDKGVLRRWSLLPAGDASPQTLFLRPQDAMGLWVSADPGGRFAVVVSRLRGTIYVVPLDGSEPVSHQVKGPPGVSGAFMEPKLDPSGSFLATGFDSMQRPERNSVRLVNLTTGEQRVLDTRPRDGEGCEEEGSARAGFGVPAWLADGRLITDGDAGLRLWDLGAGTSRLLRPCRDVPYEGFFLLATPDSRTVLRLDGAEPGAGGASSLTAFDFVSAVTREISSHGDQLSAIAVDRSGTRLVTGDMNGVVRVGPVSGEEPRLLFGHSGQVTSVAVSPDGRWIASGGDDGTIRLWPMPDLSKPPLHTLPHDELLAKLKSLTNLRAVRDPGSDTGWRIEVGPFPGWATAPVWQP